jgi:D-3-phosphoglycerate dehydrogenase
MYEVLVNTENFNKKNYFGLSILKKKKVKIIFNNTQKKISQNYLKKNVNERTIAILADLEKYDKNIIDKCANLKVISRFGVGTDNLDLDYIKNKKIEIKITKKSTPYSVAEFVVGLIFLLIKRINLLDDSVKAKKWNRLNGYLLNGKNIGIVGFGKIGSLLPKLLKGFNCNFLIYEKKKIKNKNYRKTSLNKLFKESDIITIHLNSSSKNKNIINRNYLELMKKNSFLINTSRGDLLNEDDLYKILSKKKILGAALDCFKNEPYIGKLSKLKNIILTPHVASNTKECRQLMEVESSKNIFDSIKNII